MLLLEHNAKTNGYYLSIIANNMALILNFYFWNTAEYHELLH